MKEFEGKVLFLDRNDINTDEIIPAKYLTEITKEALKPHLLEDLKLEGFDPKDIAGKACVISRANFGCGSSREAAPWAFEINGINVVIAENFARIFRQNMYNCGMLAIELPKDVIDRLFKDYKGKEVTVKVFLENSLIQINCNDKIENINFNLEPFDFEVVKAGGWVEYADKKY